MPDRSSRKQETLPSRLSTWLTNRILGPAIKERIAQAVQVLDDQWWHDLRAPPKGQPWHTYQDLLQQVDDLYRNNPLAHRIIEMNTEFILGQSTQISGDPFALAFWNDPQNRMTQRVASWCTELHRTGELFVTLHRNPVSQMSYAREIAASLIDKIETSPQDYQHELRYHQLTKDPEGVWWPSHPRPQAPAVCLHFTINRIVGELRGRSDLAPLITWLERYETWLEDRVRINRYKGAYLWQVVVEGALPGQLEAKRAQYSRPPASGSIIVTDANETWNPINPSITAWDAESDGQAIRLMIAAGAALPLHLLGEGVVGTHATAFAMNTATYRHFTRKQTHFAWIVSQIILAAQERAGITADPPAITFQSVITEAMRQEMDQVPIPQPTPEMSQ